MVRFTKRGGDDAVEERKPPTMSRSMRQLANGYAPGALFTWEGGLGACRAISMQTRALDLPVATRDLIREQIQEYLDSWLERGQGGDGTDPVRLIDARILRQGRPEVTEDKLAFVSAQQIGYEPFPLAFVCRRCDLYRSSRDVTTLMADQARFSEGCPNRNAGKACQEDWEQLDVVMVHWSGSVEPMSPTRLQWDATESKLNSFNSCISCGSRSFKLRRTSGQFSTWKFECAECGTTRPVLVSDDFTYRLLGEDIAKGDVRPAEVNMEPISYRASSAYYPQSDRVLVFRESEYLNKLQPFRVPQLKAFLGGEYEYAGRDLDDAEKEDLLKKAGKGLEWTTHETLRKTMATLPQAARAPLQAVLDQDGERWAKEVFTSVERGSERLGLKCQERSELIRRYDPMRMAVEHKTLSQEKLRSTAKADDGKDACVNVTRPDPFLLPDGADRDEVISKVTSTLQILGIAEMALIRDLQVCEFSFGYTRVSSNPTVKREAKAGNLSMPVRLNLFDRIFSQEKQAFPVYCLQQANEAFYVRLDESVVREWLERNGMAVNAACPSGKLGGLLLEEYDPFDRFLNKFRHDHAVQRGVYPYVYTLLHTMAHQLTGVMSELSGLDLGSFGEHLFVPDLAFLVYRRGVTMDLGNLSSMWRNHGDPAHGNEVLHKMVMPETLRCGAETICMTLRGGACPDCVLIPENACLTRNELLSRSVLIGRGTPRWDADQNDLVGFYDVARERALGGQP